MLAADGLAAPLAADDVDVERAAPASGSRGSGSQLLGAR